MRTHSLGCWLLLALLGGGCSALIEVDATQCSSDRDCDVAGLGGVCVGGVCTADDEGGESDVQSSNRGTSTSAQTAQDSAPDAGMAAAEGPGTPCGPGECEPDEACIDDTCITKADAEDWLCERADAPAASGTVRYTVQMREFVSRAVPANLMARACRVNDLECVDPLDTFEASDDSGEVSLDVPTGFMGFIEVSSDDTLPALYIFSEPLLADKVGKDVLLVAPSTLTVLATFTGLEPDASLGLVVLEAFSCDDVSAGGIHFEESQGSGTPFYIVNELPNVDVTTTVRDETNDIAIGGFLNVRPGFSTVTAHLGESGPAVATYNIPVRPNTMTYLDMHP